MLNIMERKRKLTKEEVGEIREIMENAPQGRKPTIRFFARKFGVNQPSVVKSLGGWKGIKRGRPEPPKRSEFGKMLREGSREKPKIQGYTTKTSYEEENRQ